MCSTGFRIDGASTGELVGLLSKVAAELAGRAAPESAAACLDLTETLATAIDLQEAALAGLVSVVDAGREVQRWGFPSTQSWLRNRLGTRDARAKERLTLARQRHRLSGVDRRWSTGELSLGYAATIAGAVARLDDEDCAAAERILLDMVDKASPPERSPRSAAASAMSSPSGTARSRSQKTPSEATNAPGSTQRAPWTEAGTSRAG